MAECLYSPVVSYQLEAFCFINFHVPSEMNKMPCKTGLTHLCCQVLSNPIYLQCGFTTSLLCFLPSLVSGFNIQAYSISGYRMSFLLVSILMVMNFDVGLAL